MPDNRYGWLSGELEMPAAPLEDPSEIGTVELPLTPEEQAIKDLENSQSTDTVVATEDFKTYFTFGPNGPSPEMPCRLNIRRCPKDPKTYRVYFKASDKFTPEYVNRFCMFLDNLRADETVVFYLGCSLFNGGTCTIGALISSIQGCSAKTIGVASGCCGVPETFLWLVCSERKVYPFGSLLFGGASVLEYAPAYRSFINYFLQMAKKYGYLSPEEMTSLWDTNGEMLKTFQQLKALGLCG